MTDFENKIINNITVETVTNTIINETAKWGFKAADYIRLVNAIMDLSLIKGKKDKVIEDSIEVKELNEITLPIIGDQVIIRLFNKEKDIKVVRNWLEDNFGRWFLLSRSYSRDNTLEKLIEDDRNILGLITLKDSTPIGLMGYLDFDEESRKAEIRKLIGNAEYREKGFAKEATILWIRFGINNLKLKKIYLNTIENNIRNVTLNKELGFQVEGILRKECCVDDQYHDILRMGLIVD